MADSNISSKQQEILDYIKNEILNHGYPPTVREICTAVSLKSTSSVHAHLATLEKEGYIVRDKTKPRAIEIVDESYNDFRREIVNIPLVGQVAAGEPILASQNIEQYFPLPAEFIGNHTTFMLRVKGDSMINIGIYSGDIIIVEETKDVHNGDKVVALIEDSATVKTFYKEKDHIRLQPENDTMEPIIVKDCEIVGKVKGLFRMM